MPITPQQLDALNRAEPMLRPRDYQRYLRLKKLLSQPDEASRAEFRRIFKGYYGLNAAHLGNPFLEIYFGALFRWHENMDLVALLNELHRIPTLRGQHTLQLSFVSKLVAIHDETQPIYDRHVRSFFGAKELPAMSGIQARIECWQQFQGDVQKAYNEWAHDVRVATILTRFRRRVPELLGCHDVRLLDFLVWKVGNQKLLGA